MQRRLRFTAVVVLGLVLVLALVVLASCSKTKTTTTGGATTSQSQSQGSGETSSTVPGPTTSVSESPTTTGATTTTAGTQTAADLYAQKCAGCHKTQPGVGKTAAQVVAIITDGTTGMPGFGGQLSAQQIQAIADLVAQPATTTTAAQSASALYAQKCAGCHSTKPGIGKTAAQVESIIRNGTAGMPSFGGQLSSAQISSLAGYVAQPGTTTTLAQSTSALYAQKCAGCHSSRPGAGLTASQAAGIIRNGTAGMPGFGGQLTSAQISNLASFVARPNASTTTTTAGQTGSALYAQKCAGCHSTQPGAGLTEPQAAAIIHDGTAGMPGFASSLSQTQIDLIADFITGGGGSTTTTTTGTHPAWKPLTNEQFVFELAKVGIRVLGSGQSAVYMKDGVIIPYEDLLDYLPAGQFYLDAQGYHYVQEEGAINPTTGKPAVVTKPPTTTTTTTTSTTSSTTTTTTAGTTTTTGSATTTTAAINAAAIYTQYCATCHPSAVGTGLTPTQIADTITNGVSIMPAFSSVLTQAQITALANYVAGGGH